MRLCMMISFVVQVASPRRSDWETASEQRPLATNVPPPAVSALRETDRPNPSATLYVHETTEILVVHSGRKVPP
jgi:hypothetical protein